MEEIYDHFICLYTNDEKFIGDFDSGGVMPNKGDIIEVAKSEIYEVSKRRIDYDVFPPLVSLYVSKFE